jgi:tripartite ATP-independent transporter DctM subunit
MLTAQTVMQAPHDQALLTPSTDTAMPAGLTASAVDRLVALPLRWLVDVIAALLLAADLLTVTGSVIARYFFNVPFDWADDVARGLMVALAFFGAAGALARSETMGITFFAQRLPVAAQRVLGAANALLVAIVSGCVGLFAIEIGGMSVGQTTGSGLPLEWTFYPMGIAGVLMTVLAFCGVLRHRLLDTLVAGAALAVIGGAWYALDVLAPDVMPDPLLLMLGAFLLPLCAGLSIGFVLALSALVFIWVQGYLPGVIFAQQMARGIDTFVLLAIPFFILVGYLMEANGMSLRLINLLERLVGHLRGGLNVVMVLSMVIFSGISGSKLADVAAVGTVLIPAARRSRQNPGAAVGLLAASAVMAETIPPCINLIILGFVANISIGGLFVAGLLPAGLMALALISVVIAFGHRALPATDATEPDPMTPAAAGSRAPLSRLWLGAAPTLGLVVIIFVGFKSGFATATEISAFGALYALFVGGIAMRRSRFSTVANAFIHSAARSGLVLFIIAASQAVAYVLTLEEVPHTLAAYMIHLTQNAGSWLFMLLSIAILIVMGSVLEGAAALIIFGPLLVPVALQLGLNPLHYGVVLVIAMGIGLFAPPLGMGLYSACLIGRVSMEDTVRPTLRYLGLLLVCLILIAFVPALTLWLPKLCGY